MRLIVLDTNVVISARLNPAGTPARVVMDFVLTDLIKVVTCPRIVQEYFEVAERPKFTRYRFPPPWLTELVQRSMQMPDPAPWPNVLPDPSDAPFLALAQASGAWLITGNLRHFPKTSRRGVSILSPAEYLAHLGETV